MILALAHYFAEGDPRPFGVRGLMVPAMLAFVPFVLVALQPDLGTASTFLPILAGIAWVAGVRYGTALRLAAMGAAAAPLGYFFLLKDYQRRGLFTFINPDADPLGAGYQIVQSKIAVGSGGMLGKGLFSGSQSQYEFLPAQHTDLVFAVLGEELGFMGVATALLLYMLLLLRILQTARLARDRVGTYVATGVAALLLYHLIVNVGMVIGFAPDHRHSAAAAVVRRLFGVGHGHRDRPRRVGAHRPLLELIARTSQRSNRSGVFKSGVKEYSLGRRFTGRRHGTV